MSVRSHSGSRSEGRLPGPLAALMLGFSLALAAPALADDNDGDGYDESVDCDDGNPAINPGAFDACDGVDNDCNGVVDDDPDPIDGMENDGDLLVDEGFGFCQYSTSGPGDVCQTPGRLACNAGVLECELVGEELIYQAESLAEGNCFDGVDNDCDGVLDVAEASCQTAEVCDGLDNDGDGVVDDLDPVACEVGTGVCANTGVLVCAPDGSTVCSAVPTSAGNEGVVFGNSCADGLDNNCDGLADLADPACFGFGEPEICGNLSDDDGDGLVDEGFPSLGLACNVGVGACAATGVFQCSADGLGVECDATPGFAGVESESAGTCTDFIDNDCDGLSDAADPDCADAFADLGVTCSLPYDRGKRGADCNGWHVVTFDGGSADTVQADLLALDTDGTLLAVIEDVQYGDLAHLASRQTPEDFRVDSKTNRRGTRHTMFAPMPILKVTGTKNGVEDVAYCSILPYLEVEQPDGVTISLDDESEVGVEAFVPLVDVDTLSVALNGVDIIAALGIDPAAAFPTAPGTALCTSPGECVFQMVAGCGDGALVPVEVRDLRVEGLDTMLAGTAKDGSEAPEQVNTVSFELSGLPPGGHVVFINGGPLPLRDPLSAQCVIDDLADTGRASAFGVSVDSPFDQEVVAVAPVNVTGKVCGGNEIASLAINGLPVDVSTQTCTTGDGVTSADECFLPFNVAVPEKQIADAAAGTAPRGTFKRGSNRVVADATDVLGNRTFDTDTVFGLGAVQSPAASAAMAAELAAQSAVRSALFDIQAMMTTNIDPAFVVGLEESAVQDFFNAKCQTAINQFTARATTTLENKSFGTIDIEPGCSCDLTSPVVLEDLDFTPTTADPVCAVDFTSGRIDVRVNLPDIRIQVGVDDQCTTRGLFGECLARTKVRVQAVTRIEDIAFDFFITEDQIETASPPDTSAFTYAWTVLDNDGTPLFASTGTCDGGTNDGRECYGDPMCGGGTCVGVVTNGKDEGFNPVTINNSGIECWGGSLCEAFQVVGAVLIEVFTFGLADGFEIVDFLDFDFEFNEDFLGELTASEPDPMELDEIEVDEDTVASAGHAQFTPGDIDVEIEDGGLTVAFPAEFSTQSVDPSIPETPGAVLTPARAPTVSEVITVGDEVTMLVADDVFGQVFASMKQSGNLQAFCNDLDGLTVNDLLPAEMDGGCETLGGDNIAGATIRGLCHAIRGADCSLLPDEGAPLRNTTKAGVCHGFSGNDCSMLPLAQRPLCNATPYRDIQATDGILVCGRQDMEPDLLIEADSTLDSTVDTQLILEDLNVVFALDRAGDGYAGELEALPGCFAEAGNGATDCRIFASCVDLTLRTRMGIDSSECTPDEAGFVFALLEVIPSGTDIDFGVMCSSPIADGDEIVLFESLESKIVDTISNASDVFTPPICVEGLTLGGVLNFSSDDAKLFGLTTDGGTGFSDYLGITVGLNPPEP